MKVESFSTTSSTKSSFEKTQIKELTVFGGAEVKVKSQENSEVPQEAISLDPKYRQMLLALERLLGEKINITRFEEKPIETKPQNFSSKAQAEPVMRYIETQKETSSLELAFVGEVQTQENKKIEFSLSIKWHEEFSQRIDLVSGKVLEDPLVISFDGMPPVRPEQFDFALTEKADKLNYLSNAAYLARDTNNNGTIDDGSELFGPKSGDGFLELSRFDDDSNGWIDSSDTIFKQLRLWKPSEEKDTLLSLEEVGIGALSLQAVDIDFTSKEDINTPIAEYKEASVALGRDGSAYGMFSVDLAV